MRELGAAPGGELIVRGEGREQRLQSLSERSLTGALRQLGHDGERTLAFIVGHDERSSNGDLGSDWAAVMARMRSIGIVSAEHSLVSAPHISDDTNAVVVAAATRAFFPGEVASMLEYINRGGNLLWLLDSAGNALEESGLSALAFELGIDVLPGTVIDTASQALTGGAADFVVLDQFPKHPITTGLTSPVLLPQVTALEITPLAGQVVSPLLQTGEFSWTETGSLEGAVQYDANSIERRGPLVLGLSIERKLANKNQRIVIIGDADFASTQFVGNGANQAFGESVIVWLSGDADALEFVTQAAPDTQLTLNSRDIVILTVSLLAGVPILLALVAAVLGWRRRAT